MKCSESGVADLFSIPSEYFKVEVLIPTPRTGDQLILKRVDFMSSVSRKTSVTQSS